MEDRTRWNERYRAGQGPEKKNARLEKYRGLLKRGLALDLAGGLGRNAQLLAGWTVVNADISDEALRRARGLRVLADAAALPFAPHTFDTIICTKFFEPRIDYAALLKPHGTIFLETFTLADLKYRPEFNPAFLLEPDQIPMLFKDFETLVREETDNGKRAYATYVGRVK
jgi:tellurite methyltransferase